MLVFKYPSPLVLVEYVLVLLWPYTSFKRPLWPTQRWVLRLTLLVEYVAPAPANTCEGTCEYVACAVTRGRVRLFGRPWRTRRLFLMTAQASVFHHHICSAVPLPVRFVREGAAPFVLLPVRGRSTVLPEIVWQTQIRSLNFVCTHHRCSSGRCASTKRWSDPGSWTDAAVALQHLLDFVEKLSPCVSCINPPLEHDRLPSNHRVHDTHGYRRKKRFFPVPTLLPIVDAVEIFHRNTTKNRLRHILLTVIVCKFLDRAKQTIYQGPSVQSSYSVRLYSSCSWRVWIWFWTEVKTFWIDSMSSNTLHVGNDPRPCWGALLATCKNS